MAAVCPYSRRAYDIYDPHAHMLDLLPQRVSFLQRQALLWRLSAPRAHLALFAYTFFQSSFLPGSSTNKMSAQDREFVAASNQHLSAQPAGLLGKAATHLARQAFRGLRRLGRGLGKLRTCTSPKVSVRIL